MKVICLGEVLIDFVCNEKGCDLIKGEQFVKLPGGAPANVAACIARLGGDAEFIGAVGNDAFGTFLTKNLADYNVGINNVIVCDTPTTLAFVSRNEEGDRDFQFFRGADAELLVSDKKLESLIQGNLLHLGSATALLGGTLFDTYMRAATIAKEKGCLISFDPNFRHDLYVSLDSLEAFKNNCYALFSLSEVVKVSDEECQLLCEGDTLTEQCNYLHSLGVKIVLVTMGSKGCFVSAKDQKTQVSAYKTEVVDTTGAGDAFIGAMLYQFSSLLSNEDMSKSVIPKVQFAQKVSALVCAKVGAMSALPTKEKVQQVSLEIL